jgi:extracellular matrix regulatory protein A
MEGALLDVGYKNYVDPTHIIKIVPPNSSHSKWLIKESIAGRTIIDCTHGRKTNSLIILDTGHLVLSSLKYYSVARRLKAYKEGKPQIDEAEENIEPPKTDPAPNEQIDNN